MRLPGTQMAEHQYPQHICNMVLHSAPSQRQQGWDMRLRGGSRRLMVDRRQLQQPRSLGLPHTTQDGQRTHTQPHSCCMATTMGKWWFLESHMVLHSEIESQHSQRGLDSRSMGGSQNRQEELRYPPRQRYLETPHTTRSGRS